MTPVSETPTILVVAQQQINAKLAYARVSSDLIIEESSENLARMLQNPPQHNMDGEHITESLYEYIGLEEYIQNVVSQASEPYKLERVHRVNSLGETIYLDFTISQYDQTAADDRTLLLMVEDATAFGTLEQKVIQERNELRLAQQKLAKANAQLRRLDQLKSLFFSMAAHDLRAPLLIIRGYADLVQSQIAELDVPMDDDGSTASDFLDTVMVQADWLDTIIHNVLDLHQIETNELQLHLEACDLTEIVRNTLAMIKPMATLNDQTLSADIPQSPLFAKMDAERMQQVMQNLVGNAIKYTLPEGQIHVEISAESDRLIVSITDTGRGMTAQQVAEAFELYYRTDDARSSTVKGSGLGLFIVKTLIQAHHGDISAESTPGKGSKFTFWLPRVHDLTTA